MDCCCKSSDNTQPCCCGEQCQCRSFAAQVLKSAEEHQLSEVPSLSMSIGSVMAKRHSIRQLKDTPVPQELISALLRVAQAAPTAGNCQAFNIIVVANSEHNTPEYAARREAINAACMNQPVVKQAPLLLAFVADPAASAKRFGERGHDFYAIQDPTIAAADVELAVTSMGLGCTWIGALNSDELLSERCLNVPGDHFVAAVLAIGYPNTDQVPERKRRPLSEIVTEWIIQSKL